MHNKKINFPNSCSGLIEDKLEDKLKIKPLTKAQILISLDRLTRFKYTEDKYLRVFKDIITSNLIQPKYKKSQLDAIGYEIMKNLAQEILNFSIYSIGKTPSKDYSINKKLLKYEKSVFKFDKNVEILLDNKIDYKAALSLINDKSAQNLKWLKTLEHDNDQIKTRENFGLKFPIEKIVIAEGITEEILLPKFAKFCGCDFDKIGINIISAGGKNQVVKLFYQFADILKLPLFVLLDIDAKENYQEIIPKLRKQDKVHVLSGEFEDTLPLNLVKRCVNKHPKNFAPIAIDDLRQNLPMTHILDELFRARGIEFKKAEFASLVEENISSIKDVPEEIETVLKELN